MESSLLFISSPLTFPEWEERMRGERTEKNVGEREKEEEKEKIKRMRKRRNKELYQEEKKETRKNI